MKTPEITINRLVSDSYQVSEYNGWHSIAASLPDRLCLIHSEVSEALEEFRSGRAFDEVYYEDLHTKFPKPCGIPIEMADIVIRAADFCGVYNIDLQEAIRIKQAYNKTRPQLHGGKKL